MWKITRLYVVNMISAHAILTEASKQWNFYPEQGWFESHITERQILRTKMQSKSTLAVNIATAYDNNPTLDVAWWI